MKIRKCLVYMIVCAVTIVSMFCVVTIQSNAADSSKNVAVFRLYNPNTGEHFYTPNQEERDHLIIAGWNGEEYGWMSPIKSNKPVYRLYNPYNGDHHYTLDTEEKDNCVKAGWNYEGVGWYSSESEGVPVYRQYNPNNSGVGSHNYTIIEAEKNYLVNIGWQDENIGWYGINAKYPSYPSEPPQTEISSVELISKKTTTSFEEGNIIPRYRTNYLVFNVKNKDKGNENLQRSLDNLSQNMKKECEQKIAEIDNSYAPAQPGDGEKYWHSVVEQSVDKDYYSFLLMGARHYDGVMNGSFDMLGCVYNSRTGNKIDITHFCPDKNLLIDNLKESFKNDEKYQYIGDIANQYFESLRTNDSYHFNYYLKGNEVVVILNCVEEMGTSRNMAYIYVPVPRQQN